MTRSVISKRRRRRLRGKVHGLFGPHSDLLEAKSVPVLERGSIGRRAIALEDMAEDHMRMIEKPETDIEPGYGPESLAILEGLPTRDRRLDYFVTQDSPQWLLDFDQEMSRKPSR